MMGPLDDGTIAVPVPIPFSRRRCQRRCTSAQQTIQRAEDPTLVGPNVVIVMTPMCLTIRGNKTGQFIHLALFACAVRRWCFHPFVDAIRRRMSISQAQQQQQTHFFMHGSIVARLPLAFLCNPSGAKQKHATHLLDFFFQSDATTWTLLSVPRLLCGMYRKHVRSYIVVCAGQKNAQHCRKAARIHPSSNKTNGGNDSGMIAGVSIS